MNAVNIARSGILLALTATFCGTALAGPPRLGPPAMMDSASMTADMPANLRRQLVGYATTEAPGTVIVDTSNTYLYLVLGGGAAIRYGIVRAVRGSPGRGWRPSARNQNGRIGLPLPK
jgi:lipoprotein-anchoring transpeptidase ErfK/SrfK